MLIEERSLGVPNLLVLANVKKGDSVCQPLVVAQNDSDGLMQRVPQGYLQLLKHGEKSLANGGVPEIS